MSSNSGVENTVFLNFREHSPNFGSFPYNSSIRKSIGSRLKHVATDSVSKKYPSSLLTITSTFPREGNLTQKSDVFVHFLSKFRAVSWVTIV